MQEIKTTEEYLKEVEITEEEIESYPAVQKEHRDV